MSERKSLSGGDWLAVGTFLFGTLVAVLMAYGMWSGVGGAAGTGAMAAAIAGAIGPWPALIGGAGIALLGARAFLTGERAGLVTGILGVLGVAIGLSVVAGSISIDRGGALGAGTGGRVAQMTHAALGIVLGAIVAFGAAYFAWMREDPAAAAKLAPARRQTPAPPKSDDGVSAAESAMLFPSEHAAVVQERPKTPPPAAAVTAKAPYPEDVRRKGEIPPGTAPLATTQAPTPPTMASAPAIPAAIPAAAEPAVYRWTAPRGPAADPKHVSHEEIEALADVAPPIPEPTEDASEEEFDTEDFQALAQAASAVDERVELIAEEIAEEPVARPLPPRPTWETTGLAEDDEPVDAYGTPLSLVERARLDRGESAPEAAAASTRIPREIGADDAPLEDAPLEDEVEVVAAAIEVVVEEDVEEEELDEPEVVITVTETIVVAEAPATEQVEELVSLLDELRAHNAAARAESGSVVEAATAEADAEDEYDVLEEELVAEEAAAVEADDDEEDEVDADEDDEEFDSEELETEELVAVELVAEESAADELADEDDGQEEEETEEELEAEAVEVVAVQSAPEPEPEPVAAVAPEPEPVAAPVAARPKGPAKPAAPAPVSGPSLFDGVEGEPEVVLQPQAAMPASRAEKTPGRGIDPEKKLLVEVGCMFVERGRVAVSMLQRQYDMDFDQACRVLDDLQEMGLIGPYMGGKNRDILLSKEQWMEKVGAA